MTYFTNQRLRCRIRYITFLAFATLLCHPSFAQDAPGARTWTSRDGKHTTEAILAGFKMGQVMLRKTEGGTVAVPLVQLSEDDQKYVIQVAEDDAEAVEALVKEKVELRKNDAGQVIEAVFPPRSRVGKEEIKLLTGLPNLQRLGLVQAHFSEGAFDQIGHLPSLRQLDLTSTPVGNAQVRKLADLKGLESLSLSDTRITNRAVSYLKELPRLSELSLANTRIGDQGIAHLEEVKTLKKLNLNNVRISPRGILRLRKALPDTAMEGSGVVRR